MELTDKQAAVVAYLKWFVDSRHYPPTARQISDHFGWVSTNAAAVHLILAAKKGAIIKTKRGYIPSEYAV